jgi:predicted MFS family arabinose efflux permease
VSRHAALDRPASQERRRGSLALLALTVFTSASTMHFQVPILGRFATEFDATPPAVGWVPTLCYTGFLLGIVLLVPLGDRADKRRLILVQLGGLVCSVLAMAAAPTLPWLWAASFAIGLCASLSQYVVPLAVEVAAPRERGAAVGTVMSGLFVGVLFGRLSGGIVATMLGWRWIYVISAAMLCVVLAVAWRRLPSSPPGTSHAYTALLKSMAAMYVRQPALRRASAIQLLLGLGYGGFWATLAVMLAARHGYGPTIAGLIAIPGAAGILISRAAGQALDRRGPAPVVMAGAAVFALAFVVLAFGATTMLAVIAGAMLLDVGLRATMVANQTLVTSVDPQARSRLNTVFQAHMWGGNAAGAALASTLLTHAGWWAVCGAAFMAASLAVAMQRLGARSA